MNIQERRTSMGWTQEQLAHHAGLSVRTIQRVERGETATLESLKCLAAVFETNVSTLVQEQNMTPNRHATSPFEQEKRESEAIEYVQNLKGFYVHCILYAVIMPCLLALNLVISPDQLWVLLVAIAWLAGLALHGVIMFSFFGVFGAAWEQKQFRKRMDTTRPPR